MCDNLLQRGLNSCRFWPHFLEVLKGLLNFLRDHMLDIVTDLKQAQRPEVAALLESRSYVTFAHWRWHTLDNVCEGIDGILDTLRQNFIFMKTFVSKTKDVKLVKLVHEALTSAMWKAEFWFVTWFSRW